MASIAVQAQVGKAPSLIHHFTQHQRDHTEQGYVQVATLTTASDDLPTAVADDVGRRLVRPLRASRRVMVESKLEKSAPLEPGARMQAERFFRDGFLLLGPVETIGGWMQRPLQIRSAGVH